MTAFRTRPAARAGVWSGFGAFPPLLERTCRRFVSSAAPAFLCLTAGNAGRDPDRPAFPAVRQRNAGAALETNRRHVRSSSGGNAPKPDQTPARAAGRVRKAVIRDNPAGIRRFLQSG